MVICVGKDSGDRKSKKNMSDTPEEEKVPPSIRKGESGPISTVKERDGLEDPNNVIFGGIESDMYVVEPDDSRPRRLGRIEPPEKPEKSRKLTTLDHG